MCGLAGFLGGNGSSGSADMAGLLARMNGRIAHRGPDSSGVWTDPEARIALGHRRLAIIDLSPAGEQPMASPSGRYLIAYNGEIYNHLDVRAELEAARGAIEWRGHSDTETLLAAIDAWGIAGALQRSIGMFAFALWDRRERELTLARDRVGEKPIYYGWQGSGAAASFLFGSELKALVAHPSFDAAVDRGALSLYMRHNCVPAPYSIYQGIRKLMPGCFATVSLERREPVVVPYWSLAQVARQGVADPLQVGPTRQWTSWRRCLPRRSGSR
jgi:asparagine synthase (glutamine-hydrolysing)